MDTGELRREIEENLRKSESVSFYVRYGLEHCRNWKGNFFCLAKVLENFYPNTLAYLENYFKQHTTNPFFFEKVIKKIGLALFEDKQNKFFFTYEDLLREPDFQQSERKDVRLARKIEKELEKGFLLVYHWGAELYQWQEEKGEQLEERFVERQKDDWGERERYWKQGEAEEWVRKNKRDFVQEEEDFLKLMLLERNEDIRMDTCFQVRLAGREELDRLFSYESKGQIVGYRGLNHLVEEALIEISN